MNKEIIDSIKKVIKDSEIDSNKIKHFSSQMMATELDTFADELIRRWNLGTNKITKEDELAEFCNRIKTMKRGYVLEDIKLILWLASVNYFGITFQRFDVQTLMKVFIEYGLDKKDTAIVDADIKAPKCTKRNMWLSLVASKKDDSYYDYENINHTSLEKLRKEKGDEYVEKEFSSILALMRGETKIGKDMPETPKTWEKDPLID